MQFNFFVRISFKNAALALSAIFPLVQSFCQPSITSPDVASINKFIDHPVDKRTGIPSISIPIYTIDVGGYSLPVSISYHAGGIGVEEIASSVGLGWSLNASGSISRSVMDSPDEAGYFGFGVLQPTAQSHVPDEGGGYGRDLRGGYDTEPDVFSFNINGYSGKFVIDKTKTVHLMPEQDLRIEVVNGNLGNWKITDPTGAQYYFGSFRDTDLRNGLTPTAWHLQKIVTPSLEEIEFEYVQQGYSMNKTLTSRTVLIAVGAVYLQNGLDYSYSSMNTQQVSRIKSKKCDIIFNYGANKRLDFKDEVSYSSIMYALDNIQVKDNFNATILKRFDFVTSYFTSNGTQSSAGEEAFLKKRLRLDKIIELGLPPYEFNYNRHNPTPGNVLPTRMSRGQDWWGLYNGKDSNTGLFPTLTTPGGSTTYIATNNDRDPNENYSKAFILDEIVYPAGGITSFIYEGVRDNAGLLLGGLRVKEVRSKGTLGQPDILKQYQYSNPYIIGGKPKFIQEITDCPYQHLGSDAQICLTYGSSGNTYAVMASASPTITMAGVSSQYIFHEKVTEVQAGNGSIESYYDRTGAYNQQSDFDNDRYPIVSTMPLLLGTDLIREVYKDVSGNILKEIVNDYFYYTRKAIDGADAYKCFQFCGPEYYKFYGITTGCAYLTKKKEYTYGAYPNDFSLVETNYEHKGIPVSGFLAPTLHQFTTKETTRLSDGTYLIKRSKYPLDYKQNYEGYASGDSWSADALSVKNLVDRFMVQKPVEQMTTSLSDGTETITQGSITLNKITNYPSEGKTQLNPRAIADFQPQAITTYSTGIDSRITKDVNNIIQFQFNDGYKEKIIFDKYDAFGNLLDYHQSDGYPVSFSWGYNHSVPTAEVKNASSSEVYFESFEESTLSSVGNDVTIAHTGSRFYGNATLLVNWIRPNTRAYTLSYWVRQNGKWNYAEQSYSGTITLTGGTQYDDISIYPTDAMIATYAYKPLVGMSSSIKNNYPTFYEYDNQNRLNNIKDHNKDILSNYTYHYRNQSTQFSNTGVTISVQKNNCPNLAAGTMVEYAIPAARYTSTVSQEDADAYAQQEIDAQSQMNANSFGSCTGGTVPYLNVAISQSFNKVCPIGMVSDPLVYSIPAGTYTSNYSQSEADGLAYQDLNSNGQANANANAVCSYKVGIEWESSVDYTNKITRIRFYNEAGTTLLYDLGPSDLNNPYFINRAVYKIVAEVNGVTYNNLTVRVTNGSTSTPYCQSRTGNSSVYNFNSMNLSGTNCKLPL